jgi:hypothetical protein
MEETTLHKFDFSSGRIPKISSEELNRRLKLIIPCIQKEQPQEGETLERLTLIEIKDADPKNSFMWDVIKGKVLGLISHGEICVRDKPMQGGWYLKTVCESVGEFITIHGCGHPMMFKPSIEEVLAQLPEEIFDEEKLSGRKLYFTTKMLNETDFLNTSMISSTYHIAKTRVYIDKL